MGSKCPVPSGLDALRNVAVDEHAVGLQNAALLACDLGLHPFVIALPRVRLSELGRPEESAVVHAVERRGGQEVEGTRPSEIDAVVLEALACEIAAIERDRLRAELECEPCEPWLEESGPLARRWRPARIRSRRDVEDPLATNTRERPERALEPADEFLEDRRELHLAADLAPELVALIEHPGGASEQGALRPRSGVRQEAIAQGAVHYRDLMPHSRVTEPSHEELLRIYALPKTIAVVGASTAVGKAAHDIPQYLQSQGYRIVPVTPRGGEILGARAFPSLRDVDLPIDVVEVFRPPKEAEAVARDAVAIGAKVLWFQPGTDSDEAVLAVANSGVTIVTGRCMGVTHGLLGLGPGPHPRT